MVSFLLTKWDSIGNSYIKDYILEINYIGLYAIRGNSFCRAWNSVAQNLYNISHFCTIRK
ncbi:hypothetical protein BpHYR1_043691 [Brachionus plicatilis]|uniref:Uncharacterized protein n=1 Tax=Brachionus plicatilis TaxID=10195 RepID=A0A3M7RQJ2_BRAPC|nr:hypothetical protein BpHYR1_043691 [Brachionus plicatilis]